jgi:hypothetical protein
MDEFWEHILEGEQRNYAMCSGTGGVDQGKYNDSGIVPGHAYSLIRAAKGTDRNGQEVRLVQMRNPWKEGEWNGRFSDKSDDWTPELKEQLGFEDKDDGLFWILFEDMVHVFDAVDIVKYDDHGKFSYLKVTESRRGFALVKFKISKKCSTTTTFAVSQRGCRTEEAEGNSEFELNSYARRVMVGICKLKNPKQGLVEGNTEALTNYRR